MSSIMEYLRGLFSSSGTENQSKTKPVENLDPDDVLLDADDSPGAITISEQLIEWQENYNEEYTDFLTVQEALQQYEQATQTHDRLQPFLNHKEGLNETDREAVETVAERLETVIDFIETRDAFNQEWVERMKQNHADDLNSYFDNPAHEHTDNQFQAIFRNDNFNRVNAAAGTGKTTTFGRRVHFLLKEFDDVSEDDLLAFTFTRNGANEMETELDETFDITGVDVRTMDSYAKSVAESHYPDIELLVEEAKQTELANIWRDIKANPSHEGTYEEFMEVWKRDNYNPDDIDAVEQKYNSVTGKSKLVGGESIDTDSIPEENLAHQAIAQYLTSLELDYDYQVHLDWAPSSTGAYVLDFQLVEPAKGNTIYIEYCTSEETRSERPFYRNLNSERAETIERLFTPNPEQTFDPDGKEGVVLDGEELLEAPSDTIAWNKTTRDQFKNKVTNELERQLEDLGVDTSSRLTGQDFKDHVYDLNVLEREVVDKVEDFIQHARVREWTPEETEEKVEEFLDEIDDDEEIPEGVPEFADLAIAAYRQFEKVFDKVEKMDFHAATVLTRDLLEEEKVESEHLYTHVFVDEMQDLNPVQFSMVKQLAQQPHEVRVFGVGDDWQSIFGFRGARPNLFIDFGEHLEADNYEEAAATPIEVFSDKNPKLDNYEAYADSTLESNHRCPDTVVKASNVVIKNNEIRTEKDPKGHPGGDPLTVHHLGCDLFDNKLNDSMIRKIKNLMRHSPYAADETQVLLRQMGGDPIFYSKLKRELPNEVDIRTVHDAKGSEAEHVIIPKMIEGHFPSFRPDKWTDPVNHPPKKYQEENADYLLEEERRLFYVALTRAVTQLDIITVQGAESLFVAELPNDEDICVHKRPLSEEELNEIKTERETRRNITGVVDRRQAANYATLDWDDRGLIGINMYDATDEQIQQIDELAETDTTISLENCGIQYRSPSSERYDDALKLELQLDEDVTILTKAYQSTT
ncbi:UvrD-helicase domain-containing protein [Halorussus sp. MSC15.2]|uniref:UvrD-helicase domain-containing protein n=1 Tax=Halorussus sp. MSC15.2 TaxID=2283638 RepID=UPI0013D4FEA9|nr:UvrD-helicase domain-containing protein [Halorussus sp. MSC15.2]NEU59204.1 UvrD-helicase domain-containing protein [Halorussus sp. MSC15.2]